MQRQPSSGSTLEFQAARAGSSAPLIGSLLLLAASFGLLVLGPTMLARFQSSAGSMPAGGYLNIAAASGIALGGGAAMIAVVARLVRDIELRPYAGLGPVLAVFTGFVLWGLRASFPLQGIAAEYVGVLALSVSVAGGALITHGGLGARFVGWALTLFAPASLFALLWSSSGQANALNAATSMSQPLKMHMGLLVGAALSLGVLGEIARALRERRQDQLGDDAEPPLTLSRSLLGSRADARASTGTSRDDLDSVAALPLYANKARASASASARVRQPDRTEARVQQPMDAYVLSSQQLAQPTTFTPKVSVWDFEDEPMKLPEKHYVWKALLLLVVLVGGGGAALYYGMMLPNQHKEQAAMQVLKQRQVQIQAAEQREVEQKRQLEAKAAAQRLEELLRAPETAAAAQEPSLEGAAAIPPAPGN